LRAKTKTKDLEDGIVSIILKEGLRPGDAILPELKLATLFGVSRVTVRQAVRSLSAGGILRGEQGRGTFVAKIPKIKETKTAQSNFIGLVCYGGMDNPYMACVASGLEKSACAAGFRLCVASAMNGPDQEEELIRDLIKKGIDGIVISPINSNPPSSFIKALCASDAKIVLATDIPNLKAPIAALDNNEGTRLAVQALIDAGHVRIAHIRGPMTSIDAISRFNGYRNVLEAAGLEFNAQLAPIPPPSLGYSQELGRAMMEKLLELPAARRPTAVFAANDDIAIGAWKLLKERGLSVPDDISLIGFGNLRSPFENGLALASIDEQPAEIGRAAWALLQRRIAGDKDVCSSKTLVRPALVMRQSVAKLEGAGI